MFMLEIKICIKNIGVQHSLENNETATMFFLKKPFLVLIILIVYFYRFNIYSATLKFVLKNKKSSI